MKRYLLLALVSLCASVSFAQFVPNGYYRFQNYATSRYLYVCDNRGSISYETTDVDLAAILLWKDLNRAISDPASVVYVNSTGGNSFSFHSQGTNTRDISGGYDLLVNKGRVPNTYEAYQVKSGASKYLCDERTDLTDELGIMGTRVPSRNYKYWKVIPISATSENYFGLTPSVSVGTEHYAPFFAEFAFSFASAGMTAYAVKKVEYGMAVIEPIQGNVMPGQTPMLVKCSSKNPADNKLNILTSGGSAPQVNHLKAVYFCYPFGDRRHQNATAYNPETMRMLQVSAEGKLVFATKNTYSNPKVVPANIAYLRVPAGSPDVISVVTQQQFDDIVATGIDEVISQQTTDTRVFNMAGIQVADQLSQLQKLPAGVYIVGGKKYIVK